MISNCVFCKIINGDIPSTVIYEDDYFKGILDISPANKGHVVILTKKHFADFFEMDEEFATKALLVAQKVAKALKMGLNCDGVNILQNNGEAAGQTVFHYHIHVIPRYKDDKVNITWSSGKYDEGEAAELAVLIKKYI
ncbi:MAG: HIT family protein [Clostridiales bacterium]|nr:HIT family protein [Clostridiales bacterium]